MIVREEPENFVLITQHDHAYIAGELFSKFKKDFIALEHYESLKFAIHQHDRSWVIPDSNPIINELNASPYSFLDYPTKLKLYFYKIGIDQVDRANSYAAILCSMHYANHFEFSTNKNEKDFFETEKLRQKYLMDKLKIPNEMLLNYQLKILKFCDNLSLYICMNKFGASKEEEHEFFKSGFEDSEFFHKNGETRIQASFKGLKIIKLNSSPFEEDLEIKLSLVKVLKNKITKLGLAEAYDRQTPLNYVIKIT